MKKYSIKKIMMVLLLGTLSVFSMSSLADNLGPATGYWYTSNGESKKALSIVQSYRCTMKEDGKTVNALCVRLIKSLGASADPKERCTGCQGKQHNQLMRGITFIGDLRRDGNNDWAGGYMLDLRKGSSQGNSYGCNAKLVNGGDTLKVHVYLGLPMMGKSLYWQRVPAKEVEKIKTELGPELYK